MGVRRERFPSGEPFRLLPAPPHVAKNTQRKARLIVHKIMIYMAIFTHTSLFYFASKQKRLAV